jgi:hypothetical protein
MGFGAWVGYNVATFVRARDWARLAMFARFWAVLGGR